MSENLITALHDERQRAAAAAKAVLEAAAEAKRDLTAEENQTVDRAFADMDSKAAQIAAAEKIEAAEKAALESRTRFTAAIEAPVKTERGNDESELRRIGMNGGRLAFEFEKRDVTKSTGLGNPVGIAARVNVVAGQVNPFIDARVIDLYTVSTGNNFQFPRVTALGTAAAVSEAGSIGESDGTLSSLSLTPAKYATLIQVTDELVRDAAFDIAAMIAEKSGQEVGIAHGAVAAPAVAAAATVGKTGAAVAPVYADLVDLVYSVNQRYRKAPGAGFIMNDATLGGVRKLLDSQNRPIFEAGNLGGPDTLLGFPVYSGALADTGDEAISALFGDLKEIKTLLVGGVEVAVSNEYAFANGLVTYRVQVRGATGLAQASAVKSFKGANV
jgi:HK97 family phage major capsid protein